jgi:hypothetical protein
VIDTNETDARYDTVAILMTHPELRSDELANDPSSALILEILGWVDEFRNVQETDPLFEDLAIRAEVALDIRGLQIGDK